MKFFKSSLSLLSSSTTMMIISFTIITHVFLLFWAGDATAKMPKNLYIPGVILFGDSIVDQGNNNNLTTVVKCNFPPYGKDFGGGLPTGRFTNGKTPSDLIAQELGIKDVLPAYLDPNLQDKDLPSGVSFASGGTGFDPNTPKIVSVLSLEDQLKLFKEYLGRLKGSIGEERTKDIMENSIVIVVAGSDDLANTYFTVGIRKLHYDVNSYTDLMLQSASTFLQEIYKLGARRIGVFGVPPIGCLPSQRTLAGGKVRGCAENYNEAAQLFNSKLSSHIDSLHTSLPHSTLLYIDIYNPFLDLIQSPQKYGFKVVDKGCCGSGTIEVVVLCNHLSPTCPNESEYLFWDSYHPTEKAYKILVHQILQKYITRLQDLDV